MADALVKISWRKQAGGLVFPAGVQGGIAGNCFTLDCGMTLAAADVMAGLFTPNAGFDACRVFVVERPGSVTALREQALQSYPAHDACVIEGFSSATRYVVSQNTGGQRTDDDDGLHRVRTRLGRPLHSRQQTRLENDPPA